MINLRGIVVILAILLIASSTEKMIHTFSTQGFYVIEMLTEYIEKGGGKLEDYSMFLGGFVQIGCILASYFIEVAMSRGLPYEKGKWLIWGNIAILMTLPVAFVIWMNTHPLFNSMYIFNVCIVWFKLISWHHVWNDVRHHLKIANERVKHLTEKNFPKDFGFTHQTILDVLEYPRNLSLWHLFFF